MPTTAKRATAKKGPAKKGPAKKAAAKRTAAKGAAGDGTAEKTAELSERVLKEVKSGQESAIEAVRSFMESVDKALPPHGDGEVPSRRQEVIDSALEMSEKLVRAQYDFLRNVVHSAGETLGGSSSKRK